jgi:hypothetical protein
MNARQLLREYVRELLQEDAVGFVKQIGALVDRVGSDAFSAYDEKRGHHRPTKEVRREIKRAFRDNADHAWLATLNTVHWAKDPDSLAFLRGKHRDELSATISLPGEPVRKLWNRYPVGLWVSGRITLAADDMDAIWSGHYGDYMDAGVDPSKPWISTGPSKEQSHRARSSGINKLPLEVPLPNKWRRMAQNIERKPELVDLLLDEVPYILDQETWGTTGSSKHANEALVDNWRARGIVATGNMANVLRGVAKDGQRPSVGIIGRLVDIAEDFGVPIVDDELNVIWSPVE